VLKAGIFLDMENLNRCGGHGIQFRRIKALVEAQKAIVVRANAYMAVDRERENVDADHRQKRETYRNRARREGYHLILKEVRRYRNAEGETVIKADSDLELAIDSLLQSQNLDYVLLGTGDGDFVRLVRALQNRGKRVDLLSFMHTSTALREEVDHHFSGYLVPGILFGRGSDQRLRGYLHAVNEEKGFGFLTVQTGLGLDTIREDVFLHITDLRTVRGEVMSNADFAYLRIKNAIIEFELEDDGDRQKAINAVEFRPELL